MKKSHHKAREHASLRRLAEPSKRKAYKDLYGLSLAIAIVRKKCQQIDQLKTFPPGLFGRARKLAKELSAEIAHKMAEALNECELEEYVHFVRLRSQQGLGTLRKPKAH